jgi:hypothetical protein
VNQLFGKGATSKCPIMYALNTKRSPDPIYKGTSEALESFLRAKPAVCDQLNIVKLYPGGFIALVSNKDQTQW